MKCICPECKNEIDLSKRSSVEVGHTIECETCGIVLEVRSIKDGNVETEIVDEGK
jgi:lysine biosynthesis protein LysW